VKGTELQLSFTNMTAGRYTFKVYDLLGVQILNRTVQHTGGTGIQKIQLTNGFASGFYITEIVNEKGETHKQKITIQ
jgi:hypothetical protein